MSTPKKDYYAILEVSKEASLDEIRKSYRKLAVRWHPDKNPNNRDEAEAKFKEISEAHAILSDEDKRKKYDQFGVCDGDAPQFEGGFPDLSELFGGMFGGMGGMQGMPGMPGMPGMFGGMGQQQKQKPVQESSIKLTLDEIYNGTEKVIEIQSSTKCNDCTGTGSTDRKKPTCTDCKGRGMRTVVRQVGPGMIQQQTMPCGACNQKGFVIDKSKQCNKCKGKGATSNIIKKNIAIKKNFDYQTKMHLRNAGLYDIDTETNADVYLVFKLSDLEKLNLSIANNFDLVYEQNIHIWDAFSGYSMYYNHPDKNKYLFKFDDVIKNEDIKFIKNLGLPCNDNNVGSRGKFIIKFNLIYPDKIMDSETLKSWLRNKEKLSIDNKSDYKKEKVYNVNENEHFTRNDNDHGHDHGRSQAQQCPVQ